MEQYLQSYVKTAQAVIRQELDKDTLTIEEMEFVCMYYLHYIKQERPSLDVEIESTDDEQITIRVADDTLAVSTVNLFVALWINDKQRVIRLFGSKDVAEFQHRLDTMSA